MSGEHVAIRYIDDKNASRTQSRSDLSPWILQGPLESTCLSPEPLNDARLKETAVQESNDLCFNHPVKGI